MITSCLFSRRDGVTYRFNNLHGNEQCSLFGESGSFDIISFLKLRDTFAFSFLLDTEKHVIVSVWLWNCHFQPVILWGFSPLLFSGWQKVIQSLAIAVLVPALSTHVGNQCLGIKK